MDDYLLDLKIALQSVNYRFYNIPAYNRNGNPAVQQPEDNFCSELIRYLRNIKESTERRDSYSELNFDFNILKNRFGIQPDIVLHSGADNQNRQEIFIEVKTNSNAGFREDLNKLKIAISDELNFNHAVMIVINKNLKSTLRNIREFAQSSQLEDAELQKIFLFHAKCINANQIRYSFFSFNNLTNPINE